MRKVFARLALLEILIWELANPGSNTHGAVAGTASNCALDGSRWWEDNPPCCHHETLTIVQPTPRAQYRNFIRKSDGVLQLPM